jgi:hypothetical protein
MSGQHEADLQYFRVVNSLNDHLINAVASPVNRGVSYFSSQSGVLSVPKDSLKKHSAFVFSTARHNPKYYEWNSIESDTVVIVLDAYARVVKSGVKRMQGFDKMRPIFLKDRIRLRNMENKILQKRIMRLTDVPLEVKGISGRVVPSRSDTGLVLTSLRWSDIDFMKSNVYQEEILSRIDSGLFRELGDLSILDMIWSIENKTFNFSPLSNLEYPSPIIQDNAIRYNYYLVDSVQLGPAKCYRIAFDSGSELAPLFQGDIWLNDETQDLVEAHLKLYKENQINYADSLEVHWFVNRAIMNKDGGAQHLEVWLNLLGYKLKLDVNSLLLSEVKMEDSTIYVDKYRVVEYNELGYDTLNYFLPIINGNERITANLENNISLRSKDYKLRAILDDKMGFSRAFFLTGANYHLGHGYVELYPFVLMQGFNTVEGWYFNYRSTYHYRTPKEELRFTPYLRYGIANNRLAARAELFYEFNPHDPIKLILEGGAKMQQFNELEPINPLINTLYSLTFARNYLKIYQKEYIKFTFDKELFRGLEALFSLEVAKRTALFNNSSFNLFSDGSNYEPNNIDREPYISEEDGFTTHRANTIQLQLFYQFGRRYDFVNNKLVKLESPLPRLTFMYRTGVGFDEGMPNYDMIRVGVGNKTRIKNVGLFEFDFVIGGFYNEEHIEFADFQHFNGVQTAFINNSYDGWTDVRQFSTLPYYDYSTHNTYAEIHLKHRFLGWLMSKPKNVRKYTLQSYTGYNFLYTEKGEEEIGGAYNEVYFGIENIFRVLNVQTALGIDSENKVKFSILLGVNFDYTFYLNARNE